MCSLASGRGRAKLRPHRRLWATSASAVAAWTRALGLALTLNAPLHRANVHNAARFIDLALEMDCGRIEMAHIQYYGWALINRAAAAADAGPTGRDDRAGRRGAERLKGRLVLDFVIPDYYADAPKACMGGWGREVIVVAPMARRCPSRRRRPAGDGVPQRARHAARRDLDRQRGLQPLPRHGVDARTRRGCANAEIDWGGCRCQAMALAGAAEATDPACALSPATRRCGRSAKRKPMPRPALPLSPDGSLGDLQRDLAEMALPFISSKPGAGFGEGQRCDRPPARCGWRRWRGTRPRTSARLPTLMP